MSNKPDNRRRSPHDPHPLSTMWAELIWEGKDNEMDPNEMPSVTESRSRRRSGRIHPANGVSRLMKCD